MKYVAAVAGLGIAFLAGVGVGLQRTSEPVVAESACESSAPSEAGSPFVLSRRALREIHEANRVEISGLAAGYEAIDQVAFQRQNVGSAPVYTEFDLVGEVVLLRFLERHDIWENHEDHRCLNGLMGNTKVLQPDERWDLSLKTWTLAGDEPGQVLTDRGVARPVAGFYRVAFRYTLEQSTPERWDEQHYIAMSDTFTIGMDPDA